MNRLKTKEQKKKQVYHFDSINLAVRKLQDTLQFFRLNVIVPHKLINFGIK